MYYHLSLEIRFFQKIGFLKINIKRYPRSGGSRLQTCSGSNDHFNNGESTLKAWIFLWPKKLGQYFGVGIREFIQK
jgi:hypothetical protein